MVLLLGASCLLRALQKSPGCIGENQAFARKSLSFNHNSRDKLKNVQLLLDRGILQHRSDVVIWHDVISNSITPLHSNSNTALSKEELFHALKRFDCNVVGIVYLQRKGTPDIFDELCNLKVGRVINGRRHLLPKFKQKQKWYENQLAEVHPHVSIELNFINIILREKANLHKLTLKNRSKTRKRKSRPRKNKAKKNKKKKKKPKKTCQD